MTVVLLVSCFSGEHEDLSQSSYSEEPYQYYNYYYQPRYHGRSKYGRTLWSGARSIMPRIADGAREVVAALALPALALLAVGSFIPEVRFIRSKRDVDGR